MTLGSSTKTFCEHEEWEMCAIFFFVVDVVTVQNKDGWKSELIIGMEIMGEQEACEWLNEISAIKC